MRNRQKGFSLIELLIVVAIILIIAGVAIPNLLRNKMTANEAATIGALQTLNTAAITYSTIYGGYPHSIANLGPAPSATAAAADLIDSTMAAGTKSGYIFTWNAGATDASGNVLNYSINADPINRGTTGQRSFFTDQSGVIRYDTVGRATAASTPL